MKKRKGLLRCDFKAPLVIDGVHICDLDCAANITRVHDIGGWYVDSWVIYGPEKKRAITLKFFREEDPLKERLRIAVKHEWHVNASDYYQRVAEMLRGEDE